MSYERFSYGFSINVWFVLSEAVGSEDILTQLLKLSEDTIIVSARHVVSSVVVVI